MGLADNCLLIPRQEKMLRGQTKWWLLLFAVASMSCAYAQYELPDEIFQRTLLIRSGKEQATAFKFDQGGTIYLVTTRHFGHNLPSSNAVVEVWHNQTWNELKTVRTIFPESKDVNLAVIETAERIAKHYTVVKSTEVLTTGQRVWLMGWLGPIQFPPNMDATMQNPPKAQWPLFPEIPFVSIGTVSAIEPTRPDAYEIDARRAYNLKIAGGPIVYWSSTHRDYEILGVIERNERDAERVQIDGKPTEYVVKSWIVKGYEY
jgi:hypothetical protein